MKDISTSKLTTLLSLQHAIQEINSIKEFSYFVTNKTHQLIDYEVATLWEFTAFGKVNVLALSENSQQNSTQQIWLTNLIKYYTSHKKKQIFAIHKNELPEALSHTWPQSMPEQLLYCPFYRKNVELIGGLLIGRRMPWQKKDEQLLTWLTKTYAFCWHYLNNKRRVKKKSPLLSRYQRCIFASIIIAVVAIMFFPITQTVLTPAHIVAKNPAIIPAPMEGIIDEMYVKPNQSVSKGQPLFTMDTTELENANFKEEKILQIIHSKYLKAVQKGFKNRESRNEINVLKAQMNKHQVEIDYNKSRLMRASQVAPIDGVAIFGDTQELIGKPLQTGEKVMLLANPNRTGLEIWLPVTEAINIKVGAPIKLYSNKAPLNPIKGKIIQINYQALLSNQNILAYRLLATLDKHESDLPIGTQGTAKLYGKKISLFFYLFDRPLIILRQRTGW